MEVQSLTVPTDIDQLQRLVREQYSLISQQHRQLERHSQDLARQHQALTRKDTLIERLEEKLRLLQQQRFGRSSEKHRGQGELHLFNEAEVVHDQAGGGVDAQTDTVTIAPHTRRRHRSRPLPAELPRVEVVHDLAQTEKTCGCGQAMRHIGDNVSEQLSVIPQQYFVTRHIRRKYACGCKQGIRTAAAPAQPLAGSQASASVLAHVMVSKYHDGLPLHRQEKMAARVGLHLPRAKLARWLIHTTPVLQPLYNLLQEELFSYDIAMSDDTGIQVLKEHGRRAENKSYLWIRRGGPPDKAVVLVDYSPSKSGATAYGLLSQFHGYLVCDAATNFNHSIERNKLVAVLCNDHARRKFADVIKTIDKKLRLEWVATKAIEFYKQLYRVERDIANKRPADKYTHRQSKAVPIWDEFIAWAHQVYGQGVRHGPTREALQYLLGHEEGLRRYCTDGRLPISNIQSEHVAKTIAIARKNFLFADTPAGARSSAMIYSIIESAKANRHNAHHYLAAVLTALPAATTVEDIEALLPWNLTSDDAKQQYQALPTP